VKILCFACHSRYITPKQKSVVVAGKQESRKINAHGSLIFSEMLNQSIAL
jgi:hypothetical protein